MAMLRASLFVDLRGAEQFRRACVNNTGLHLLLDLFASGKRARKPGHHCFTMCVLRPLLNHRQFGRLFI
jgi:hypothetical protein